MTEQPFLEMRAFEAALSDDDDALLAVLDQLLPGELRNLADAADRVSEAAYRLAREKREQGRQARERGQP